MSGGRVWCRAPSAQRWRSSRIKPRSAEGGVFGVGETMVIVKSLSCLPVARGTATAKITAAAAAGAKPPARAAAAAPATPPAATATAVLAAMTYDGHVAPGEDPGVEQGRDGCRGRQQQAGGDNKGQQAGPAAQAGMRPGDVIVRVDGKAVSNVSQLLTAVAALKPGQAATFEVQRAGQMVELNVTPGLRPMARRPVRR